MPKKHFLLLATLFSAGLVVAALALQRWLAGAWWPSPLVLTFPTAGLAAVAAGLLMAAVRLLVRLDFAFMRRILDSLRAFKPLLLELHQGERLYIAVLAGFSEELLFRGVLQPLWGIVAASLIFGALHAFTLGYFVLAAAMGFYLGGLFQVSGTLLVPMAVHVLYDFYALNLLARIFRREERQSGPSR